MKPTTICLDHNATTPLEPEVLEAMLPFLAGFAGNPSSRHALGRRARQAIDRARGEIAQALNADPNGIIFTSGATESNNLAILGAAVAPTAPVVVNPTEHPSSLEPAARLGKERRWDFPLDPFGRVVAWPADGAPDRPALVIAQLANSETGTIQDIAALKRAAPAGSVFHCDAAQAVGKIPVDFRALGVSTLAFSGHKLHGPTGIGALLCAEGYRIRPVFHGGHQQAGLRPGTEPVANIVGLAAAVAVATRRLAEFARALTHKRDRLESALLALPNVVRNGPSEGRLPNTTNLSFLGARSAALIIALDLEGICCSAGSACASGALEPSAVLGAMKVGPARLHSAIRFAVARTTTDAEIDEAAERIARVVERERGRAAGAP